MNQHILVKRDLFGTILQKYTWLQACRKRKQNVPILDLTDEQLQKLIQQEQEQGRKVSILPAQKSKCWWNTYQTAEEVEEMMKEKELELTSSIPPTEQEIKEWENRPRRTTAEF